MPIFYHENRDKSEASKRLYARYEMAHTAVDFLAAIAFLVGSVLFFDDATQYTATWLFVIGSLFFAMKPTLRLTREIRLYRMGKLDTLAKRAES
ncbi:YrhK family protein [Mesobacterium sp. TK19101]|uniref:YrhK family protein n=1 Tax=Mesobacterium hydrothermale TaxID=3111907 RepID=A0ABU6HD02_9RHOB|nr:YrhK family protein [Mesobacterium sp. TK19101]MEC3859866.1 YrhK family protein [Mesobacterium sp. TK19101]